MEQQLIVLPEKSVLALFTEESAIDPFLKKIRDAIDGFHGDVSTEKGRKDIASMAYKVARSKSYLDGEGKKLADEVKLIPKKIDATRKRVRDTLEEWQDEVRKPLTDWELARDARIAKHNEAIAQIRALSIPTDQIGAQLDADTLRANLAKIEAWDMGEDCDEFKPIYEGAISEGVSTLERAIEARVKFDAEQAELAKLRKEAEERAEQDRLELIRREAADKAKREAEEKAERDRIQAEQAAETYRKAEEMQRIAEREAAEKRERELLAEKEAAEKRAADAETKAKADAEEAKRREEAEAHRREQDRKHRAKINNAAVTALVKGGIDESVAKSVIVLVASKSIPAVAINY